MNNKKIFHFNNFDYKLLLFFIPFLVIFGITKQFIDNDFWFTINQGRYVLENGFPNQVLFTVHSNLDFIYQSWGTGVLFYTIFHYTSYIGILLMVILFGELFAYLTFKLSYEITNKKQVSYSLSIIITLIYSLTYLVTRPHIITSCLLLVELLLLEKYYKTNNKKYLYFLPLLALLIVNIHGMYFMIFLVFMLPYIVNLFKFSLGNFISGYKEIKPLLFTFVISFIIGFINPYTYKTVFYFLSSYGNEIMRKMVIELNPASLADATGKFIIILIGIVYVLYIILAKKKIPVRYILLLLGSTYLALDAEKSFNLFLIGSTLGISYLLSGNDKKEEKISITRKGISIIVFSVLLLSLVISYDRVKLPYEELGKYLEDTYKKSNTIYTSLDTGGYLEYLGYKCYIDARAEVFLKDTNHKDDIFLEYYLLQNGMINPKDFLNKYSFDLLVIDKQKEILYYKLDKDNYSYKMVYQDDNYVVYERKK
ncbi:MAG: hypothetical protein IIZ40_02170 [Bacilli bacterium]|nr:hypothetical protein [Bacilli bacterium]